MKSLPFCQGIALWAAAGLAACSGGTSSSETTSGAAATGSGGPSSGGSAGSSTSSTGSAAGSGGASSASTGAPGSSAATTGAGGASAGTAGSGAGGSTGGSGGGACPAQTSFTLAVHVIVDVTWPSSTATNAGSGKLHLWNKAILTANGLMLSGDTYSCGTLLPEFALNGAGMIVTGGSKVLVEVPNTVWDAPASPKFSSKGSISGWDAGSSLNFEGTVALVGLTMADPMGMWPASYTGIMPADSDGDSKPGFTAVPRNGGGYVPPPTGLGLFGSAPSADRLYLVSRTIVGLAGSFTSCTEQSGTANVPVFDSHVVGCHVTGGADCIAMQIDFVDQSRTLYKPGNATFQSKKVPDGSSCADVRTALPM